MPKKITFNDSAARTYRKRTEVLAFQTRDAISFHKSWGEQSLRADGWVIVPLTEHGEATDDIYGCDAAAFRKSYVKLSSGDANRYRKQGTVRAYQPGEIFELSTQLSDGHVETASAKSTGPDAWIVRSGDGETYPIEHAEFQRTYVEVD